MTVPSAEEVRTVPHVVHRLEVAVGASFDDFRRRYEQAVPRLDAGRLERLLAALLGFLGAPVPGALTAGLVPAQL
jgi:hypothetical protein